MFQVMYYVDYILKVLISLSHQVVASKKEDSGKGGNGKASFHSILVHSTSRKALSTQFSKCYYCLWLCH